MSSMVDKASVAFGDEVKVYIGAIEQTFKRRCPKHKDSLQKDKLKSATSLSKHVWDTKKRKADHTITWDICTTMRPIPVRNQN